MVKNRRFDGSSSTTQKKQNNHKYQQKQQHKQYDKLVLRKRCGQTHKPPEGAVCHACGIANHYAKMCFYKFYGKKQPTKFVQNIDENENSDKEENFFVG